MLLLWQQWEKLARFPHPWPGACSALRSRAVGSGGLAPLRGAGSAVRAAGRASFNLSVEPHKRGYSVLLNKVVLVRPQVLRMPSGFVFKAARGKCEASLTDRSVYYAKMCRIEIVWLFLREWAEPARNSNTNLACSVCGKGDALKVPVPPGWDGWARQCQRDVILDGSMSWEKLLAHVLLSYHYLLFLVTEIQVEKLQITNSFCRSFRGWLQTGAVCLGWACWYSSSQRCLSRCCANKRRAKVVPTVFLWGQHCGFSP